ncbi:hypothetical protein [Streptosporangium sp. NBC_01756]|uniref:hypothetical protein n=1 Tax=Streptosporangium sp. NBC_01756 TaxID=2975950 RepID=UPI002DDAF8A9|nr:hypothetical protein [Streptosporangium sp. NBC_01756]WSC87843.1 hypothetical protein OIE48_06425 [Streptosporangium sp. NBC_01756]
MLPDLDYTLNTAAVQPGYVPVTKQVRIGTAPVTEDTALTVALSCIAPGYRASLSGTTETFDNGAPAGWAITNTDPGFPGFEHEPGWTFGNPGAAPTRQEARAPSPSWTPTTTAGTTCRRPP